LNVELDGLLAFETPEKNPSREVTNEYGSTRGSRRVSVFFYIDVSKANNSKAMGDEVVPYVSAPSARSFWFTRS
jgi:hypothetical protein